MKKTFLKAVAAATVVAATVALSSVGVFANYGSSTADGKTTLKWDFGEYSEQRILEGSTAEIEYEGLKLVGEPGQTDKNKDYVDSKNGFHTNGVSTNSRRYIEYTTPYAGTLSATFKGTGNGDRNCFIGQDSSKTKVADGGFLAYATSSSKAEATVSSEVEAETKYRIYVDAGISIIKVEFSYDAALDTMPSIKLDTHSASLVQGQSMTVTATAANSNGAELTWIKTGSENITMTSEGEKATISVTDSAKSGESATIKVAMSVSGKEYSDELTVTVFPVDYNFTTDDMGAKTELFSFNGFGMLTPYDSPVYLASDPSVITPFEQAAVSNGGSTYSSKNHLTVTLNAGDTFGIYYTITDSGFATKNQAKSGYAVVYNSKNIAEGQEVFKDSNAEDKKDNYAYYFEFTVEEPGSYAIGTSTNRLAVYGVNYKKAEATDDNAMGATDGAVAVIKGADGTYYAVVIVSEETAKASSALNVKADSKSVAIDTVYDSVVIDGTEYTANKIGGNAGDYVSGIELKINNTSSATVNAAAIQNKLKVEKVAVETA